MKGRGARHWPRAVQRGRTVEVGKEEGERGRVGDEEEEDEQYEIC